MPCGILGSIQSLVKTAGLFVGEGQSLLERNADFLHYKGVSALMARQEKGAVLMIAFMSLSQIYPELKKFDKHVNIDKSNINSGDYLAIARFDGLDPMSKSPLANGCTELIKHFDYSSTVMYGTGSVTGHSALAMWEGDQLYVTESTGKSS